MGPELLVVAGVIALLFGGSQLPKLARSLGSAKTEFEKAQVQGKQEPVEPAKPDAVAPPPNDAGEPR